MSKLVCGVGINDANYLVHKYENIKGKKLLTWTCPFYQRWTSMLSRCYVNKSKDRSYVDCSVVQQWHHFMIFKSWMVYKLEQATILASMQPDQRIAEAIVKRYQSYKIDSNY